VIRSFRGHTPSGPNDGFIDPTAVVVGDVELGEGASVWPNSVLRGDVHSIRIGARTNIQDLSMVHVTGGKFATRIGDDVTVGHRVVLHGCTVGDRVLVGMGAVLLDGVEVGDDCIIGAGSLLTPGTKIPPGSMALGSPAKVRRALTDEERAFLLESAAHYVALGREHRGSLYGA
jgi:carbonic anhydrase/acetyltransferase-like protein (isoleucine patch superfamily)